MKLIHKKFIGKDTQIIMVYSKGRYTKPSFHVGDKLSVKGKELRKIE